MVEVTFTPTAEDYVAVQRAMFVRQLRSRRFRWQMARLLAFMVVAMVAIPWLVDGRVTKAALLWMMPFPLWGMGAIGIIIGCNWLLLPRRARRLFAQQKTLHHDHHGMFDATGFRLTSTRCNVALPWHELLGWHAGRKIVLLYNNEMLANFVPVRAFGPGELAQVEALLTQAGVPRR